MADLVALASHLSEALPGAISGHRLNNGELSVDTVPGEIVRVMSFLRDDPKCAFKILVDICGVDWPERPKRFDVVYHLLSLTGNQRLRLHVHVAEDEAVPSVVGVYPAANWFERETYDMYGIAF